MTQRKNILLFLLLLLCSAGIFMWIGSHAPSTSFSLFKRTNTKFPTTISIGVVDINRIKSNSKVFQKFKNALDNLNAKIHQEILQRETKLSAEYEQFKKSDEEGKEPTQENHKQRAEFDKKVAELEKIVRSRREELDQEYTSGLVKIKQDLKEIIDDLGKTLNLKIILNTSIGDGNQMDQSIVLYCNDGLDLTDEVIKRLDK